jgi:hypothetical protein
MMPYRIPHVLHTIEDEVDPTTDNYFFISMNRVMNYQNEKSPLGVSYRFMFTDQPGIQFALKHGMKIILDQSWEMAKPFMEPYHGEFYQELLSWNRKFIEGNKFKFLTNAKDCRFYFKKEHIDDNYWENIVLDSNFFEYNTRLESHNEVNIYENLLNYPVDKPDKKYTFSLLTGEIRKNFNSMIISAFMSEGLLNKNFYTSLMTDDQKAPWPDDPYIRNVKPNLDSYALVISEYITKSTDNPRYLAWSDYLLTYPERVIKHKPFDSDPHEFLSVERERRFPQQAFESLFSLVTETASLPLFYTEKTFKYIKNGVPFFIVAPWYNTMLKKYYGYELFEEVFDYSIEQIPPEEIWPHFSSERRMISGTIDMIKKMELNREHYADLFTSRAVQEKVDFNRNHFMKRSSRDSLLKDVQRIFYDTWE